jgi:hypothetical protein
VLWKEIIAPLIALEFVSGDGAEERDATSPFTSEAAKAGKFWVYASDSDSVLWLFEAHRASLEVCMS